jgi:hypothetical protein
MPPTLKITTFDFKNDIKNDDRILSQISLVFSEPSGGRALSFMNLTTTPNAEKNIIAILNESPR